MLNDSGIQRVLELLDDDLTHIAIGTGTAPNRAATKLTAESYRKAVSENFLDGNVLVKEIFLDESEGNVAITEWGIFCNGATTTPGTGNLFASTAASIQKDNTQSLTLSVEIEVVEVA